MTHPVSLRAVIPSDLPVFFEQQLDSGANYQAAFTVPDPSDRAAFDAHWERIRSSHQITLRTVLSGEQVAGYVASFERFGEPEVSYWLGREFWGQGIATRALTEFLKTLAIRPLYARVAHDNAASLRVLEKCGFVVKEYDRYHSHARGHEVEEVILVLPSNETTSRID